MRICTLAFHRLYDPILQVVLYPEERDPELEKALRREARALGIELIELNGSFMKACVSDNKGI